MDYSLQNHASYIGRPVSELPTPSLILSKPVLERNTQSLLDDVKRLGITFRPHVKTLKCTEVTRMMLGDGEHRQIVASTLSEIRGALDLVKEGKLDECLYGLPISASALPHLQDLTKSVKIILMIDSEQQIDLLDSFASKSSLTVAWPVFIKIDVGSKRAGMVNDSPSLPKLIQRIESSSSASVYGFYCHAGHSYACRTEDAATAVLQTEVEGVVSAARFLVGGESERKIVVSVGSTPTAHVVKRLQGVLPEGMELELHAGNYPANDLQQVATSLVEPAQQAVRILADVCSIYPERNEALINAGTVALSKETSEFPGYAVVTDRPQWSVVRMAQEHGILGWADSNQTSRFIEKVGSKSSEGEKVESAFTVGDKLLLYIQHACITAAMHFAYYVVDEDDIVRETWVPWKGW
ncbi:hypothetical protein N7499_005844 [Penicillium canescens]|uniref:D-serine dehydratase n=1 Tax=Penicillium canescens TaxID=5083 RepID=A0AAD6ICP0_PENCN|nr:hypothetical protein N7460_004772 [Penicillium canescens]KAJ6054894.1 hypothetical protein N7444_003992 [Penicillium canescens]KAJ6080970.1 hypothetical protein N7499_005844 [Penicillium canescens]KAJ6177234.1 hypothetical protein N7485_004148 [Penicillium canescens]